MKREYKYYVVLAYECWAGQRGELMSRHTTYELAERAAKQLDNSVTRIVNKDDYEEATI